MRAASAGFPLPRLLFLLSNVSAVAYALVNMADWTMATMFLGNAAGCSIILGIGGWKRLRHRNRYSDGLTDRMREQVRKTLARQT